MRPRTHVVLRLLPRSGFAAPLEERIKHAARLLSRTCGLDVYEFDLVDRRPGACSKWDMPVGPAAGATTPAKEGVS